MKLFFCVPSKPSALCTNLFSLLVALAGLLIPTIVRAQDQQQDSGQLQLQLRSRPSLLDPDSAPPTHRIRGVHYKVNPGLADNVAAPGGVHPNNTTPTCNSPKLSYFGGPVISNAQPVVVFWSSNVNLQLTQPGSGIAQFLEDVGSSPFFGLLTQYSTTGSAITDGTDQWIGNGNSSAPTYTLVPSRCGSTASCTVTDAEIQTELNSQIGVGALPPPTYDSLGNDNTIYMIYFPPNVTVNLQGSFSCQEFCAYHNTGTYSGNGQPLVYGVLMDEFTTQCNEGCGGNPTAMENMTSTSSHEYAEAVTDADIGLDLQNGYANPAAWGDNNNGCGEIADICDSGNFGDMITVNGRNWVVQELWSNEDKRCESSGTVTLPYVFGSTGTVTAGLPFNFTLTAQNPTGGTNAAYLGTVHFTSSDPSASLPADYTYTGADAGVHTFQATLETGASQTITVSDVSNPSITNNTTIPIGQTIQVSVGTSPTGISFTIDGASFTTTQTPTWTIGTSHTIATNASQSVSQGIEDVFQSWSDGGALSHSVTASASTTSYTAHFGTAYQLTIAPNNVAYGSVTPASGGYYPVATSVAITATPMAGSSFSGWAGSADIASASSASTTITMNSPETVTANFAPGSAASLSSTSLSFGTVDLGSTSGSQSVTLTNTGGAALSIGSINVTGANASSFVFANSCGASVAPGANCSIHGHFAPTASGAMTAAITITDNAGNSPQSVALSGTGITAPKVSLTATSLSFASEDVGATSGSDTVTLTNTGTANLSITIIGVTGANASSFVFANNCPTTVAPGANCTIHGHFSPLAAGALTAAVTIVDNAANSPQTIALSGTGIAIPLVTLSATKLSFGNETLGNATGSQTVTLTNSGSATLSITSISVTGADPSSFAFANSCGSTLTAGANCTIHGHFAPSAAGALTAAITITDNAANSPQSISLTGTGVSAGPAVSLSATSLAFGTESVGSATASQAVTLTNTGGAALTIGSIALTGADPSSFVFANSCGPSLAAGANCSIHGHFAPTLTGAITAAITITDNAAGSPQSISLSGTGH